MVMFWPTMVSVALRAAPVALGETVRLRLPAPLPLALVGVNQDATVEAVQPQPAFVEISMLARPPPEG